MNQPLSILFLPKTFMVCILKIIFFIKKIFFFFLGIKNKELLRNCVKLIKKITNTKNCVQIFQIAYQVFSSFFFFSLFKMFFIKYNFEDVKEETMFYIFKTKEIFHEVVEDLSIQIQESLENDEEIVEYRKEFMNELTTSYHQIHLLNSFQILKLFPLCKKKIFFFFTFFDFFIFFFPKFV